jgi:aquaporin Z
MTEPQGHPSGSGGPGAASTVLSFLDFRFRGNDGARAATLINALQRHWPEYLIEATGLALFMIVAGLCVVLLEHPASPLYSAIPTPELRRVVIGIAMGATAVAIIYSPWGRQSGAHLNPAITLTFLRLHKVAPADALFYVLAQFAGGAAGTLLVAALLGDRFTLPPISAVATLPGRPGEVIAFGAEATIAFVLMSTVLATNVSARLMRWTGLCAGLLVAIYIMVEAPLSGMSLNPARSVASAVPSGVWHGIWIYLTAPPLGMLLAAELYLRLGRRTPRAKLNHFTNRRCIFHCDFAGTPAKESSR